MSLLVLCLLVAGGLCSAPAFALNWMFLTDSPGPFMLMSDADRELFQQSASNALEKDPDGVSSSWQSPESDAHGEVEPLSTFDREGMRCRTIRFDNHAEGQTAQSEHTLCKTEDDSWALAN